MSVDPGLGLVNTAISVSPVTIREMASPPAAKVTVAAAVVDVVGVKRTVTSCVAPDPTRVKGLPETMLKGCEVEAVPETVPPRLFCTVKVRSAKLPTATAPKCPEPLGLTDNRFCATALADIEQALSLPNLSTATTAT
jgi:hypothetical protein